MAGIVETLRSPSRLLIASLCLGIATCHALPAAAQAQGGRPLPHTGAINGQVVDQQSRAPVLGATVNLIGTRLHTLTDSAGRFSQTSLGKGTYIIEVRCR